MEYKSHVICNICDKPMNDSRILNCFHSFCLRCIESLSTPVCPSCQIEFEIPKGGSKNLKKNEFIELLHSLTGSCIDCNYGNCLEHLQPMKSHAYANCRDHVDVMNLFCKECSLVICGHCLLQHNSHKVVPVKELFDSHKKDLEKHLKMKMDVLKNVVINFKSIESLIDENEVKATNLKAQIHHRAEGVKKIVDSVVDELKNNVDEEVRRCYANANGVLLHLKIMESTLNAQVDMLNQEIKNLNFKNLLGNSEIIENFGIVPSYSKPFDLSLVFHENAEENYVGKMIGTLFKKPKIRIGEEEKLNKVKSFSLNENEVFVAYCDEPRIEVFDIDGFNSKSNINFGDKYSKILDLFSVDDMLFVLARHDDGASITKIDKLFESDPVEIYNLSKHTDDVMFSKLCLGNILLIVVDRLIHLTAGGEVLSEINLKHRIFDALQIKDNLYVVSHFGHVCTVNVKGQVVSKYLPTRYHHAVLPYRLAVDGYNNIYVSNCVNKFFVLDFGLKCISSHDVNKRICGICYNKVNDEMLALTDLGKLVAIKI